MSSFDREAATKRERLARKLEIELGAAAMAALADPEVTEVLLNPDGRLWTESHGVGFRTIGRLEPFAAEQVIGTVAASVGAVVDRHRPIVSGELPIDGSRFEGVLPPVAPQPSFSIRKRAAKIFSLDEMIEQGVLTAEQGEVLRRAIVERRNILICGGTGTGKTTFANALIGEMKTLCPEHRVVLIEDTAEIQCALDNVTPLRATDDVDMRALLRTTLRLRPDRIVVGEVRGGEALDLLKAWNTGHPGGIATVHANSAPAALIRLEQLIAEAVATPMRALIREAVDLVVSLQRGSRGRRVDELLEVGLEASVSAWNGVHPERSDHVYS